MKHSEVPTITELKKLSVEDFKEKIIQGVILQNSGLLGKLSNLNADNFPEKDKTWFLSSLQEVGIPIPRTTEELDETLKYVNARVDRYGPTVDD